ncbi:cytochrome P450 [Nocardia sp. NPDC046763]|uniref:cytochrome P450 family protein n=1 Tax=Nocardia sp. NPDC046763 TaxID=3155256 RepID=UPI0033DB9F02
MTEQTLLRLTADFYQNPHATYRELVKSGPVHRVELPNGLRAWLVTSYELAKQVLTDPTVSKDLYGPAGATAQGSANIPLRLDPPINDNLVYSDPPRHTRLRKIAAKALSGNAIRDFTPRIAEIARTLLRLTAGQSDIDLLGSYAYPYTVTVICELIGIDAADRTLFQSWLQTQISAADTADKYAAAANFENYVHGLMERRDGQGATDFLSELMAPDEQGDRLDKRELVAMINAILLGGQETTAALIGNTVLTLLLRPDLMEELRANPDIVPEFIEEQLRFESSGNISPPRFTTAPLRLGGTVIPAGQVVVVSLATANRDPGYFERPTEMDPHRLDNRHLAFGYGIHRCVGAALARSEAKIALSELLSHFSDISLAVEPTELRWQSSSITRGLTSLPVRVRCAVH